MILEVGTLFCSAVATFVALKDHLVKAPIDRRTSVARYFDEVAACLTEAARSLRAGEYPHGRCAELARHAQDLPESVTHELGPARAGALTAQLLEASSVELLFDQRQQPAGQQQIAYLEAAAGELRALATKVRAH